MATTRKPRNKNSPVYAGAITLPDLQYMENDMRVLGDELGNKALDLAQELIYEAWEVADGQRQMALVRRALDISPLCADAYVMLAERPSISLAERHDLYERGLKAGELAIGVERFEEFVGYFWGMLQTRPYMRARAGLAQTLWLEGRYHEAISHYREMLALNPNDNQGLRYILPAWLLHVKDDSSLENLLNNPRYEEDADAFMIYTRALFAFRKGGNSEKAKAFAEQAWQSNTHIPAGLTRRKVIKDSKTGLYTTGSEEEAADYLEEYRFAWEETPSAIQWLADVTKELKPRTPELNRPY